MLGMMPLSASSLPKARLRYCPPLTLSCMSSPSDQDVVDLTRHVALQAAHDLALAEPFRGTPAYVGLGARVPAHAADDDHVQGPAHQGLRKPAFRGRARQARDHALPEALRGA